MSERLCPACRAWACSVEDAYCGFCGSPCAGLQLTASFSVVVLGEIPPTLVFTLTNPSCATIEVRKIDAPDWIAFADRPPASLNPKSITRWRAKADVFRLSEPVSGELVAETPAGTVSCLLMAIEDRPSITTDPPEIEFWTNPEDTDRRLPLKIAPTAGCLRIHNVQDPDQPWISVAETPGAPFVASPESPYPLTLRADSKGLAAIRKRKASATLDVRYEHPHGVGSTPLKVALSICNPPELTWDEEHAAPSVLRRTAKQVLRCTFSNRSRDNENSRLNADLRIESIELRKPREIDCQTSLLTPIPATIPGGGQYEITFGLDLEKTPAGLHDFVLAARTNRPRCDREIPLTIEVMDLGVFDGVVAIDFGTSSTCAMLLENGGDSESVPLDEHRTTAPTIVRYLSLDGPRPEIETGVRIKHLAAADEEVARSTVGRLKQQLGDAVHKLKIRPRNSKQFVEREAREAASDYLHHIRVVAESHKGVVFREFILTHPAVCSLRQYRNLRLALDQAFGQGAHVHFLQEPVASLIPFVSEMAKSDGAGYTVAAFDLGGGTTDITVVRVKHSIDSRGAKVIGLEILASWGERYGGEDLTDFLVDRLRERGNALLEENYKGDRLAGRNVRGASTADELRNEAALREWAEEFKAGLSEESDQKRRLRPLLLRVVPASPEKPPTDFQATYKELRGSGQEDLKLIFLAQVRTQVDRFALRLADTAGVLGELDHIQLSGKTTFLPVVRDGLRQRFPNTKIHRADDPKECVVRGACLARKLARGKKVRLALAGGYHRTTSEIGFLDEDEGVFHRLIPLDRAIPEDGFSIERSDCWDGDTPLVLWENLGVERSRRRADGSLNPFLQKLGTWAPVSPQTPDPEMRWRIRIRITRSYTLEVEAVSPEGRTIGMRQRAG